MVEDSDITTLQLVYRQIDKEISFSVLLDLEKEMDFNMKVASGAGGPLFSSPKIKLSTRFYTKVDICSNISQKKLVMTLKMAPTMNESCKDGNGWSGGCAVVTIMQ